MKRPLTRKTGHFHDRETFYVHLIRRDGSTETFVSYPVCK